MSSSAPEGSAKKVPWNHRRDDQDAVIPASQWLLEISLATRGIKWYIQADALPARSDVHPEPGHHSRPQSQTPTALPLPELLHTPIRRDGFPGSRSRKVAPFPAHGSFEDRSLPVLRRRVGCRGCGGARELNRRAIREQSTDGQCASRARSSRCRAAGFSPERPGLRLLHRVDHDLAFRDPAWYLVPT